MTCYAAAPMTKAKRVRLPADHPYELRRLQQRALKKAGDALRAGQTARSGQLLGAARLLGDMALLRERQGRLFD